MRINSRCIHGSGRPTDDGVVPAIQLSSTFYQPHDETLGEWEYQRGGNPTRAAAERLLASIEGARYANCYATGMAATAAVFSLVNPGEKVLFCRSIYGGTYRYAHSYFPQHRIDVEFVDQPNALQASDIDENVSLIFIESPTNPMLHVIDIQHLAQIAHKKGILLAVDNTFMTPLLQRPLDLGADISLYSATKYLGGHGDLLAGVVLTNHEQLHEKFSFFRNTYGAPLAPFDSYSLLRGVKTLAVRLERQIQTTHRVIDFFSQRSEIVELNYPGSHSLAEEEIQNRQAKDIGAVISFRLDPKLNKRKFLDSLGFIGYAVSLGGVESLICTPATMTHEAYQPQDLVASGIHSDLLRLAIGIEDGDDILELLASGLDNAQ